MAWVMAISGALGSVASAQQQCAARQQSDLAEAQMQGYVAQLQNPQLAQAQMNALAAQQNMAMMQSAASIVSEQVTLATLRAGFVTPAPSRPRSSDERVDVFLRLLDGDSLDKLVARSALHALSKGNRADRKLRDQVLKLAKGLTR